MQRDIIEVIDNIIKEIPATETVAIERLQSVQQSARYAAPEIIRDMWNRAATVLWEELGPADSVWKRRVAAVFSGESQ